MEECVYSICVKTSDGGYRPVANATSSKNEAYQIAKEYFDIHQIKVYVFLTKTEKSIDYVFSPFRVRVLCGSLNLSFTDKQECFDYLLDLIDKEAKFSVRYY